LVPTSWTSEASRIRTGPICVTIRAPGRASRAGLRGARTTRCGTSRGWS
jgi:hypothetical protein